MHTEEQASRLCCARDLSGYCVGSKCMAWRWAVTPEAAAAHEVERAKYLEMGGADYGPQPATGLCGLAGPA